MKIIIHPDLWIDFIINQSKTTPNEEDALLHGAISNSNNIIGFDYDWTEFYTSKFISYGSEKYDFEDIFNQYLLELNNEDRLYHEPSEKISRTEELVECFLSSTKASLLLLRSSECKSVLKTKCIGVKDKIRKPNKHWIYYSLVNGNGRHESSLDYNDFGNNEEIEVFVSDITNFVNPIEKRIFIQSDYLNFGFMFDKIKGRRITYCSSKVAGIAVKSTKELNENKSKVKEHFGANSSFAVNANKSILHPRTLVYNNIIINLNHDFEQIKTENSNWQITFQYCQEKFQRKKVLISSYIVLN